MKPCGLQGLSVSFLWPASDLKSQVQPKKKRKRRRAKVKNMVSAVSESTYKPTPEPSKLSIGAIITSGSTLVPNKATQGVKPAPSATCSPPRTHTMKRKVAYSTVTVGRNNGHKLQVEEEGHVFLHVGR